jgi:hypothetical protein
LSRSATAIWASGSEVNVYAAILVDYGPQVEAIIYVLIEIGGSVLVKVVKVFE